MNKVFLRGNLVKDVELKNTANNNAMCSFTIGVKRSLKNQQGEYESDFINCIAYQKLAETINKYFKKGSGIIVEGHILTGSYTNKEGNKIYATNIIVERIEFDRSMSTKEKEEKEEKEIVKQENKIDPFESFGQKIQMEEMIDSNLPF